MKLSLENSESRLSPDFNSNKYLKASFSDASRKAYQADMKHFLNWGGSVPCNAEMICSYLTSFAPVLAISTLVRHVASINKAHSTLGINSPTKSELVRMTLRGIRRTHSIQQRRVAPLLKSDLLATTPHFQGLKGVRDRALLLVAFAGGMRRSEVVNLNIDDLVFSDKGVLLTIRYSKTDQLGVGQCIAIPYARGPLCPTLSLLSWLEMGDIKEGPIFRPITRHQEVLSRRLTGHAVANIVKDYVTKIGLDRTSFSGHSLRAGFVTSAAEAGIDTWKIKLQTRHKSDAMLNIYIRSSRLYLDNAAGELL